VQLITATAGGGGGAAVPQLEKVLMGRVVLIESCGDGADARLIQYPFLHADGRFVPTVTTSVQAKLHAVAKMFLALTRADSGLSALSRPKQRQCRRPRSQTM
jgi:hypothetical protein